jgi:23S rRNA (adenine2503-C2)-methyltransferase
MGFRISNVVVMGIGEPFDNYDNLISFLKIINNDSMLQIGARHITVSTSGIIDKIYEFEQSGLNVNLAVSLHSVFQAKREKIMPIAKAFDIKSLNKAIFHYLTTTKKKITLEYIMIGNFNDLDEDIEQIVKMYKNKNVYVNLIPLNGNLNKDLKSSTDERVEYFFDTLIKAGIQTIIRRTQGDDINAACGQLRISLSKNDGK